MKKIAILLILLFSISGCSSNVQSNTENHITDIPTSHTTEKALTTKTHDTKYISTTDVKKLNLPHEANILFFDDTQIIYYIDEWVDSGDFLNFYLYKYTFADDTHIEVINRSNFLYISGRIAKHDENLYIPCVFYNNNNEILEFNLTIDKVSTIRNWTSNIFICELYAENNFLYVFEISPDSEVNYSVTELSLSNSNFSEKEIISRKYEDGNGHNISCIALDNNLIYLYIHEFIDYSKFATHIYTYNILNGETNKILVDTNITEHLNNDTVISIFVKENTLVLQTLNGQSFVGKFVNDNLIPINIPEVLHSGMHIRYSVLDAPNTGNEYIYFATTNNQENNLFAFNYKKMKFTSLQIDFNSKMLNHYFTNENNNIIMKSIDETSDYFLIEQY